MKQQLLFKSLLWLAALLMVGTKMQAQQAYVKVIAPDGSESWESAKGTLDGTEFSIGNPDRKNSAMNSNTQGIVDLSQCNSAADGSGTSYTVVSINDRAFYKLAISNVIFPNTVKRIETEPFYDCSSLNNIHIPSSVEFIGVQAFRKCIGLKNITIDEGLKTLGESAFYKCENLQSITLPNSLETLGNAVFTGCASLKSIEIPAGVISIGRFIFDDCLNLEQITVALDNPVYHSENNCIYHEVTYDLEELSEYSGNYMVAGCKKSVIPNHIVGIENALSRCPGMKSIILPKSVRYLSTPWYEMDDLESIYMSENVSSIGGTFNSQCNKLRVVEVDPANTVFRSQNNLVITRNTDILLGGALNNGKVVVPEGVKVIWDNAFSRLDSLKSLELPSTLEEIGNTAFAKCPNLTEVVSHILDPKPFPANAFHVLKDNSNYKTEFNPKAKLYVPTGTLELYKATEGWKEFYSIEEKDMPSSIRTSQTTPSTATRYYSLGGQQLKSAKKGINIVNQGNGQIKKIVVK